MNVVFATGNPNKARELASLSEGLLQVITLKDLGIAADYQETGDTFHANSIGKALYYSQKCELPVIADDSGLEVDWLHGEPGVYSARFLGDAVSYPERCEAILKRMREARGADRSARFRCVASCALNGTLIATAEGTVEGLIHDQLAGDMGFGYDPIFYYPPFDATFAQVLMARKNEVSHRNMAFRRLMDMMKQHFQSSR